MTSLQPATATERRRGAPAARRARTRFGSAGLAIAMLAGTAILAAGCGGGSSGRALGNPGPTTTAAGSSTPQRASHAGVLNHAVAFAECMRNRGEPNFSDPSRKGGSVREEITRRNSLAPRSNDACKHLLANDKTIAVSKTTPPAPGPSRAVAPATDCLTVPTSPCYTPMQLRVAYGIEPLLDRGITGRGQTVVLPEFPPPVGSPSTGGDPVPASSDIRQDLADFDSRFHLPAAKLQIVNSLAHVASPWMASVEEVGDTEVVHALAPDAVIREVLIPSPYVARTDRVVAAVVAALRLAVTQGGVVSLSGGTGEQCFTPAEVAQVSSILQAAQRTHVTMIFSTGDSGAATTACPPETGSATVKGVDFPASDPLALAVGGTSLDANRKTGAYVGETAWNTPAGGPSAGGSGFSRLFARPAYQTGIDGTRAARGVPDVAADADYRPGIAVAFDRNGRNDVLVGGGGTSVAAPLWAAIIALADQSAGRQLGFINPALYEIGRSPDYHDAFHDVTTGTNTVELPAQTIAGYHAAPGWDPLTGWGSPDAEALIPLLTRYASR